MVVELEAPDVAVQLARAQDALGEAGLVHKVRPHLCQHTWQSGQPLKLFAAFKRCSSGLSLCRPSSWDGVMHDSAKQR